MSECIRCRKPCAEGERLCGECQTWMSNQLGGSSAKPMGIKKKLVKPPMPKADAKKFVPKAPRNQNDSTQKSSESAPSHERPSSSVQTVTKQSAWWKRFTLKQKRTVAIGGGVVAALILLVVVITSVGGQRNHSAIDTDNIATMPVATAEDVPSTMLTTDEKTEVNEPEYVAEDEPAGENDEHSLSFNEPGVSDSDRIQTIREQYKEMEYKRTNRLYDMTMLAEHSYAYWEDGDLKIIQYKAVDDPSSSYDRILYYDGNGVYFAYYSCADSYRVYFDEHENVIRVKYCPDASNIDDYSIYENYDDISDLGNSVLEDSFGLIEAAFLSLDSESDNSGNQTTEYMTDYVLPKSSTEYLTMYDISGLSQPECRIARNEIYARHGRMFDDQELQNYFMQFSWYNPVYTPEQFTNDMLNKYEIANLDLIVEYEKSMGYR